MDYFEIKNRIKKSDVEDLLCSALEGGSNYWYFIPKKIAPKEWKYWGDHNESFTKYLHLYPFNGGALMVDDSVADDPELKAPIRLDGARLEAGLRLFSKSVEYARHWGDFISNNTDQITADVFFQFCVFGKVIYG